MFSISHSFCLLFRVKQFSFSFSICRHVYSNVGSSPSPYSSPMQSPLSSPHVSPSTHHSNRPVSPWTSDGRFDLFTWLKQSRLHKYKKEFSEFSLEAVRFTSLFVNRKSDRETTVCVPFPLHLDCRNSLCCCSCSNWMRVNWRAWVLLWVPERNFSRNWGN